MTRPLSGWGRYAPQDAVVHTPRDVAALKALVARGPLIARGAGRAYGDSAVSAAATVQTRHLNKFLDFDPATGVLVAQAGVTIGEIIAAFMPRGFFPAVSPGTKFVTLGGAIAADVHGKNHHIDGSFGAFVEWIDVLEASGQVTRASRAENPDLFAYTLGGMGLTGVILAAAIRLKRVESGWIRQTTLPAPDLDTALALFETHHTAPYSVAWIDCLARGADLGRSCVMLGAHAQRGDLDAQRRAMPLQVTPRGSRRLPLTPPGWAMNRLSVGAFNRLYYWNARRRAGARLVDWDSYFYPLDAILGWNRIYGRRGFVQFQCALPLATARDGLREILQETARAGEGSFLAVLKRFGPQESRFSFPLEGMTLALDFPARASVMRLLGRLDAITLEAGGRFYLAKDARMSAETLRASDPRLEAFLAMRAGAQRNATFASAQSERLGL